MTPFIIRSIIQKIVTLFFVSIISFSIIYLAPGEPSQVDPLNPKFTPEMVERFSVAGDEDDYTSYTRETRWKAGFEIFRDNPVSFLSAADAMCKAIQCFRAGDVDLQAPGLTNDMRNKRENLA